MTTLNLIGSNEALNKHDTIILLKVNHQCDSLDITQTERPLLCWCVLEQLTNNPLS